MTQVELLDLYFLDARSKLLDIAAFLDRLDRAEGDPDFRLSAFHNALAQLSTSHRTAAVLETLSDPTIEPIAAAATQSAIGAHPSNALPPRP